MKRRAGLAAAVALLGVLAACGDDRPTSAPTVTPVASSMRMNDPVVRFLL